FRVNTSSKEAANLIRSKFNLTGKKRTGFQYLKALISEIAKFNVYVFEFIEAHNKKEKANLEGFFLNPNFIVIKRNSKSYSREIFTLLHEFAHYLLGAEDFFNAIEDSSNFSELNKIERWCSDFSFYFLAGEYSNTIENLNPDENSFHEQISLFSKETHLSKFAIYYRLYLKKKISWSYYDKLQTNLKELLSEEEKELKRKKELEEKDNEKKAFPAQKPIRSPLFDKTVLMAYYENIIGEYEAIQLLKLSQKEALRIFQ
ncbi:MAG: ImmA/IrrE family metallo-endopeptidase, partial [Ignavibacteriaceae bacterium]|nr:ImmA/IrrE family metallo-endopeptidase [Ignavibacteriaceae bacterium]